MKGFGFFFSYIHLVSFIDFWILQLLFNIYFFILFSPTTSASKMVTNRVEISVFVKFIITFYRLIIGLKNSMA